MVYLLDMFICISVFYEWSNAEVLTDVILHTLKVILKKELSAISFDGPALVTFPRDRIPGNVSSKYRPNLKLASKPNIAPIQIVTIAMIQLEN